MGAEIPLSQGKKAIVDAEDAPRLLARPWFAKKDQADNFYALTNIKAPSGRWETR